MQMIKVSEATPLQLNWLVATILVFEGVYTSNPNIGNMPQCHGAPAYMTFKFGQRPMLFGAGTIQPGTLNKETGKQWVFHGNGDDFRPATNWSQGGPIIESENIGIVPAIELYLQDGPNGWTATTQCLLMQSGPTPLIAAMRCYVASKLGYEVEIPEELNLLFQETD